VTLLPTVNIASLQLPRTEYVVDGRFDCTFFDPNVWRFDQDKMERVLFRKGLGLIRSRHVCQCGYPPEHPRRIYDDKRAMRFCRTCLGILEA
jgi:hypothetical protein